MNPFHPESFHPVTADGVRIEPGMTIWDANLRPFEIHTAESEIGTHRVEITVTAVDRPIHLIRWWNCYSTRELAEAARRTREEAEINR